MNLVVPVRNGRGNAAPLLTHEPDNDPKKRSGQIRSKTAAISAHVCKATLDPTNDKLLRDIFRFVRAASIIVQYEHNNGVTVLSGQFIKCSPKPYPTRSRRGYDEGPARCRELDVRRLYVHGSHYALRSPQRKRKPKLFVDDESSAGDIVRPKCLGKLEGSWGRGHWTVTVFCLDRLNVPN